MESSRLGFKPPVALRSGAEEGGSGPSVVARRGGSGFSLVEVLIVMVVMAVIIAVGLPALNNMILRSKLEGQARSLSILLSRARNEAVNQGAETVVRMDSGEFISFVDLDGVTASDPPDGLLNPVTGAAYRASDWELGRLTLGNRVSLSAPGGESTIDGLVNPDRPDDQVIFSPDGSVYSTGAFRIADPRGNYLEIAVGPRATGQVTMRKWDGTAWREQGEGGESWDWQ